MRDPKKGKGKPKAKGKAKPQPKEETMEVEEEEENAPSTSNQKPTVWQPGVDELDEDEELEYDPSAYDCYFKFQLEWPCLSFDILKDNLGGPRSAFPHTAFLVAGTQAPTPRQNHVAFVKLANLDQGKHGKRAAEISDDEDDGSGSDADSDMSDGANAKGASGPARFHYRLVPHMGGVNRIRSMPQQPGVVAVWGDTGAVRILDGSKLVSELAAEEEPTSNAKARTELKPLAVHTHSSEGFALDWSRQKAGRLASGDCRSKIHVWEPQEGGSWQVGTPFSGHKASVEDVQWSPMEETVLASCSVDKTIRIWDTRERAKPMLTVEAADCDVNVISWNRVVTYMLASGADDGSLRIWDLRSFSAGSFVSTFKFHKAQVTSVEWSPYEGSMVASAGADNQLAVWDLALERDPEEEAALAPEGNAVAPEDLPAQLLFLHAGQQDLKELRWHAQIPGLIMSTAADSFNVFKAANM